MFKKILIVIIALSIIGAIGYYWVTGTPEWSVYQIKVAEQTHNKELGLKYFDRDAIFENLWSDFETTQLSKVQDTDGMGALGTALGLKLLDGMKPTLKEQFIKQTESWFSDSTDSQGNGSSDLQAYWKGNPQLVRKNGQVYVEQPNNFKVYFTKKSGERYWVISKFEGYFNLPESKAAGNQQPSTSDAAPQQNLLKNKIDVTDVKKGFKSADFSNYIMLDVTFVNKTDNDVKGVQGTLTLSDIFGNQIKSVKISNDDGIPKNTSEVWNGQLEYNQFIDEDVKLKNTDAKNIQYEWIPDTIIYQDGSKETAENSN